MYIHSLYLYPIANEIKYSSARCDYLSTNNSIPIEFALLRAYEDLISINIFLTVYPMTHIAVKEKKRQFKNILAYQWLWQMWEMNLRRELSKPCSHIRSFTLKANVTMVASRPTGVKRKCKSTETVIFFTNTPARSLRVYRVHMYYL